MNGNTEDLVRVPSPEELFGGENSFQIITEAMPGLIWMCNAAGCCDFVSQKWRDYTGADWQRASGEGIFDFFHPEDYEQARDALSQHDQHRTHAHGHELEVRLRRHDGAYRRHRLFLSPHHESNGRVKQWIHLAIDIEAEKPRELETSGVAGPSDCTKEDLEQIIVTRTHELQEASEQLESFAYSIAHDMRAPLRTMHQYAEIVARDFAGQVPAEALSYLKKIMIAAERLDCHIHDVLVYTRVSRGRLDMQPINLERVLSDILMMAPHLNPPEVELNVRFPLHPVVGDNTALTQGFSNLLANAVKFVPSDRKPKINVWTEVNGDFVRIYVKDNGIGIAAKDQERVFKLFERLQPESRFQGSGIGLTIVRRAVERMGGKLGLESEEGSGTTFWIELKKGNV